VFRLSRSVLNDEDDMIVISLRVTAKEQINGIMRALYLFMYAICFVQRDPEIDIHCMNILSLDHQHFFYSTHTASVFSQDKNLCHLL